MSLYRNSDRIRLSEKNSLKTEANDTLFRDGFHDDVARLVHSPSFRRLARKRQLLPSDNSDFVRNRLTHSNEVAQIATSIGHHINSQLQRKGKPAGVTHAYRINPDILIFAGLAHDIGHPPFGHLGEVALNTKMLDSGGFEGNAQTLRVITKLEQRLTSHEPVEGEDRYDEVGGSYGLNLTFRSIASILKYNNPIPVRGFDHFRLMRSEHSLATERRRQNSFDLQTEIRKIDRELEPERFRELLSKIDELSDWESDGEHPEPEVIKGFYAEDEHTVARVHNHVFGDHFVPSEGTQTIECQIMDFADDVAYSIYDLEDCLKTGVISPIKLLSLSDTLLDQIAGEVCKKVIRSHERKKISDTLGKKLKFEELKAEYVTPYLLSELVFYYLGVLFDPNDSKANDKASTQLRHIGRTLMSAQELTNNGKMRRKLTSFHISHCCASAEVILNEEFPAASQLCYPLLTHVRIEFLKRLNFHLVINSDLIRADEHRGEEIVSAVFDGLYLPCDEFKLHSSEMTGYHLLPEDVRLVLDSIYEKSALDMLDIRQTLSRVDGFVDGIIRNHPKVRAFSLKRMLGIRDYEFRYSLAISLYEEFLRNGDKYREMHEVLRNRRVEIKRLVCDFIAGMTDRGLLEFYGRLKFEDKRLVTDEFGV